MGEGRAADRRKKRQGWLVEKQCPGWLHDLPILGQGKKSVAQAWERLCHPRGRL